MDIKEQMNQEIGQTVLSLGEWAKQKDNRIAFVVCGEIGDDSVITVNSLIGRSDRIARALYGNAVESKNYKNVLELAAEMLKIPCWPHSLPQMRLIKENPANTLATLKTL